MLSKRSIILDSLSTHRIDEGMIDSISKNSSSGSGDKLLKALLDCDMRTIPSKNLKSTTSFYNKSPFSEVDLIVKYEKLPSNDGRKCYIYHLTKGKKHYISISASSYNNSLDGLSRLFIYEAKDENVVDSIWDFVDKNRLVFDMDGMNSGLKDCKTVANTYRVFGSKLLSDVYGIADDLLLIEFKYMKLPVCLLVTINNGDSFDVACDKLEVAFDSSVDRARDVISSLTSYGVVATTYNTTRGSGTYRVILVLVL